MRMINPLEEHADEIIMSLLANVDALSKKIDTHPSQTALAMLVVLARMAQVHCGVSNEFILSMLRDRDHTPDEGELH